jgi:glycosyltransferase involved in cell wall biosynthesis
MRTTLSRFDMALILAFRREFSLENPAVVNVHFGSTGINGLIAGALSGIRKRIWTKHSLDAISYRPNLPWHKQWLHTINYEALWATDIISVSQAVKKELATHHISSKVKQFYLGVDLGRFASGKGDAVREELNIPAGRKIAACVSQARPEKGIEFLVRAVALLKDNQDCPYMLILGGGPLTGELQHLAEHLGVSSLINFCGVRNDVESILAISSFTVLPSLEDAAPLAIMESLAAGKPVVASCVGGIPEFIHSGVNGILVAPGDAAGLAVGIMEMCEDERLARMGKGAKESAEMLDVRSGVAETMKIYMGSVG